MRIIESIRNYIALCPHLKSFNEVLALYVDFSNSEEATTYSIEEVPAEPIIKKYIDGSSERQFLFVFSSVEIYGSAFDQNINNVGFYEDFSKWLEDNSKNKMFPLMSEGKEALKVEALTNGYLFNNAASGQTARYQVQCKLTYYQEK